MTQIIVVGRKEKTVKMRSRVKKAYHTTTLRENKHKREQNLKFMDITSVLLIVYTLACYANI